MDHPDTNTPSINDPNWRAYRRPTSMAEIIPTLPNSRPLPPPVFHDPQHHIKIYQGDCLEILAAIPRRLR